MKLYIRSGVRNTDGQYIIDYNYNLPDDIITMYSPQLYRAIHGNYEYWFGYKFNADTSSKQRSEFIAYLKGLTEPKISDIELTRFIERPLSALNSAINLYKIDCLVYPLSGRSELVRKIVNVVNRRTSHDMNRVSFELVKSAPKDIEFDYDSFEADYSDDFNTYNQMKQYVDNVLLPKIHQLDYFSLAQSVKPKYRGYIKQYLSLSDTAADKLAKLQGSNILIIDDINTSGSTLDEILRVVNAVNDSCNIFIYTLIGKP